MKSLLIVMTLVVVSAAIYKPPTARNIAADKPPQMQPPNTGAQPPNPRYQPPNPRAQPPNPRAQPPNPRAQPPNPRAQPPNPRAQPPNPRAQPPNPRAQPPRTRYQPPNPRAQPPPRSTTLQGYNENRGVHWVQATKNEFPFLVHVRNYYNNGNWMYEPCGGSIIGKKLILTAAHCYDGQIKTYKKVEPSLVRVYIGEYDTTANEPDERMEAPTAVIMHEQYRKIHSQENVNDIALVVLASDVPSTAQIICLGSAQVGGGVPVTVSGWGTTSSGGSMPPILRKSTNEKTITNAQCRATGYTDSQITPEMICATGTGSLGLEDACQGDSGGPLFDKSGARWRQVGVVSWGAGCADANYPGVYARVSVYTEYLKQKAQGLGITDVCVI